MKNMVLIFLVLFAPLAFSGCAFYSGVKGIVWISEDTLKEEVLGQQLRQGRMRTTIRAQLLVKLDRGKMFPNRGTETPEFSSHRATFWGYDLEHRTKPGEEPELQEIRQVVLQPLSSMPIYTFSQFMGYHTKIEYWWNDIYGIIQYRKIDVMILPGRPTDKWPQFDIVLTENPGKEPVNLYLLP